MPPWALYTIGVLVFAFGLLASIGLHEIGHLLPAKKFGVKVTQYMVGFGPTLFSRKRGETEYGIKAIPLGGYIRMIGMVPPRADGTRSRWPRRMATAIEDFRNVSRAEVDPADADREFYRLTPGKKMIIMLGGPCMNLLIFLVLSVVLLTTIGLENVRPTTTVDSISKCVVAATSRAATTGVCPADAPPAPAAGVLQPGDRFLSLDGVRVRNWNQLRALIRPTAGRRVTLVVERDGRPVTLHVVPVANRNYVDNAATRTAVVGFIGFTTDHTYFQPVTIGRVPGVIGSQISLGVQRLAQYPARISNLFGTVFENEKRDPNGAVGVVGISRISGDYAASTTINTREKVVTLISVLASVNLLLFFFNLLPLLPLDGGHVAGALVESAKRGRSRLRARRARRAGRPHVHKPIFVDTAQMLPVMYGVAGLLVLLTLLTLYADIVHPIHPPTG